MRSSNHRAHARDRPNLFRLLQIDVADERFPRPFMPRASRYTSTKPLIVSTADALSRTHACRYARVRVLAGFRRT